MLAPAEILESAIGHWLEDVESDVEYAEFLQGRWAVRMRQSVRDATTVWWQPGPRSVRAEAYLFPAPSSDPAASLRLCLARNCSTWRSRIAGDPQGDLVVRGRIDNRYLSFEELELLLAEIYEIVELTFPALLRLERSAPR